MKKNRRILLSILAVFFVAVFVLAGKGTLNKMLNDIDYPDTGSSISFSFNYLDMSGSHESADLSDVYIYIEGQDNGDRIVIQPTANGSLTINEAYQSNYTNPHNLVSQTYKVYVGRKKTPDTNPQPDSDFITNCNNELNQINSGDTVNGDHVITFPDTITVVDGESVNLNIEAKQKQGVQYSLNTILNNLDYYMTYGVFTKYYSQDAHTEANIAAEVFIKASSQFGLSDRNSNDPDSTGNAANNKVKVTKTYLKNGSAASGESVTLRLYMFDDKDNTDPSDDENVQVGEETCTTNNSGKCTVTFENVTDGKYTLAEVINNTEVKPDSTNNGVATVTDAEGHEVTVTFGQNNQIVLETNIVNNRSYIGSIYSQYAPEGMDASTYFNDIHNKSEYLHEMIANNPNTFEDDLNRISSENIGNIDMNHRPGILVVGSQEMKDKLLEGTNPKLTAAGIEVVVAGTGDYETIDFTTEFTKLNRISKELSTAAHTNDLKVYYVNAEEVDRDDINWTTNGEEYVLVNIDCTGKDSVKLVGSQKLNGTSLVNGFGDDFLFNESAKIIYNFYQVENGENVPYTGKVDINDKATTGIILAPSAVVYGAGGNHSGNIFAKEYIHQTGEVHQKIKGVVQELFIQNKKTVLDIVISKKGPDGSLLEGSTIQLIKKGTGTEEDVVVEQWTTSSTDNPHKITSELVPGATYIIHEANAPEGYQLTADQTITIPSDGVGSFNQELVDAKVNVAKYDDDSTTLLSGAEFKLVKSSDPDTILETWSSSDSNPHVLTTKLEDNVEYKIIETKTPTGYKTMPDKTFTFDYNTVDDLDISLVNEKKTITIDVEKLEKIDNQDEFVAGAKIELYDSANNKLEEWTTADEAHRITAVLTVGETYKLVESIAPNGYMIATMKEFVVEDTEDLQTVKFYNNRLNIKSYKFATGGSLSGANLQLLDEEGNVITSWETGAEPFDLASYVKVGNSYKIHEVSSPAGYKTAEDVPFTVANSIYPQVITMTDTEVKVRIYKYEENNELLSGALLQIKDSEGNVVEEWTTNGETHLVSAKLSVNETYTLHEESAPLGYKLSPDLPFVVSNDLNESEQEVKMYDLATKLKINVYKKDTNGKFVKGAKLQILDSSNNVVEEWTTDGTSHLVSKKLTIGETYKLHEVEVPTGYEKADDVEFIVADTEDEQKVEMIDGIVEVNVTVSKYNEKNEYLPGAVLQITDSNGIVVDSWVSTDATHVITEDLLIGEVYTLHEIEAPLGYEVADDVEFIIEDTDEVQEFKMYDRRLAQEIKPAEEPDTGDSIAKYFIIFVSAFMLFVFTFMQVIKRNVKKYSK